MQLLTQYGPTRVFLLDARSATSEVAQACSSIEYFAYKHRFPELTQRTIESYFEVSSKSASLLLKKLGKHPGYLILTQRDRQYVGYGLFEPKGRIVFVQEVHTHPAYAKGKRIGTATLLNGLQHAYGKGARQAETWVGRRSLQDKFPYDWFRRMGFSKTSVDSEEVRLGQLVIQRHHMVAQQKDVLSYLERKL